MTDQEQKKMSKKEWLLGAGMLTGILVAHKVSKHRDDQYWARVQAEKGPGIAKEGEKVIALEPIMDEEVNSLCFRKGDVLTVSSYSLSRHVYQFKDHERKYSPYLGEFCGAWYPADKFQKIEDD